jgi:MoaD family protein
MEVKYMNFIRELTHKKSETIEMSGTMKDLLDYECEQYGKNFKHTIYNHGKLNDGVQIIVNGRLINHDFCLGNKVKDEDSVCITCSSHWH